MIIVGWSVKGGSGTTAVCGAIAASSARNASTVLVDLCGDAPALFAMPTTPRPGLLEWCNADASVSPDSIASLIQHHGPPGRALALLNAAPQPATPTAPSPPALDRPAELTASGSLSRLHVAMQWLSRSFDCVVLDAGHRTDDVAETLVQLCDVGVIVIRPCALSVRAALRSTRSVVGAVVVGSGGGALHADDVGAFLGVPTLGHVPTDRSIAAAVDAGSFGRRVPRELVRPARAVLRAAGVAT